ncbi:MAG: DUF6158 family protein [Pseudonocardiaceae bacterium]
MSCTTRSQEDDVPGVPPENLSETDLLRELEHLHTTRHNTSGVIPNGTLTQPGPGPAPEVKTGVRTHRLSPRWPSTSYERGQIH